MEQSVDQAPPTCVFSIFMTEANAQGETVLSVPAFEPQLYHNQDVFNYNAWCDPDQGYWDVVQVQSGAVRGQGPPCRYSWAQSCGEEPTMYCRGAPLAADSDGGCTAAQQQCLHQVMCTGIWASSAGCEKMICSMTIPSKLEKSCVIIKQLPQPSMAVRLEASSPPSCQTDICRSDGGSGAGAGKVPQMSSTTYMEKGINYLAGNAVPTQMLGSVLSWYWTLAQQSVSSPTTSIPDQLQVLSTAYCESNSQTSTTSYGTNERSMQSQAKSVGVKLDLGKAVSTLSSLAGAPIKSVPASFGFSNSFQSKMEEEYASKGMGKHLTVRVSAERLSITRNELQPVVFQPGFLSSLDTLTAASSSQEVFSFIQRFGMAILSDVVMGATFSSTAYFWNNQSDAKIANFEDRVRKAEISVPLVDTSNSQVSSTQDITNNSYGVDGMWQTADTYGSVTLKDGACGGLASSPTEYLVPIKYDIKPLSMLPCVQSHPSSTLLSDFIVQYTEAATLCGKQYCGGFGTCAPIEAAWAVGSIWSGDRRNLKPH